MFQIVISCNIIFLLHQIISCYTFQLVTVQHAKTSQVVCKGLRTKVLTFYIYFLNGTTFRTQKTQCNWVMYEENHF